MGIVSISLQSLPDYVIRESGKLGSCELHVALQSGCGKYSAISLRVLLDSVFNNWANYGNISIVLLWLLPNRIRII